MIKSAKKVVSVFEILLIIGMMFGVFAFNISINSVSVSAAPVCCEKTKKGDFCQYVDETECSGLNAPTTCDQTSFCRPGCCFDREGDGYCYANYPRALCTTGYKGVFSTNDASCGAVPECQMGCCMIGSQAVFTTEIQCRKQTASYPDLKMDFRSTVASEAECLDLARAEDKGCCVSEDSCSWGARGSCKATEGVLSKGNGTKTGFFKGEYCSSIAGCNCAPANPAIRGGSGDAKATMCLDSSDSVYWRDSCGNPEGVKDNCDYNNGKLCSDSDKNGKYTCESTNCEGKLSMDLNDYYGTAGVATDGVLNGESWCQFDTKDPEGKSNYAMDDVRYHARDTVGSRYYRSVCINGKEFVEPCADFRQEFCVSDTVDVPSEKGNTEKIYTEAKCIKNRGQSCIDSCNTADASKMKEEEFRVAQETDFTCCTDISKRDCAWTGKCVPKVSLGFKFWEAEGSNTCGKANMDCKVTLRCGGWNKLVSYLGAGCDWQFIDGSQCFDQDFLQAANNICRAYGDCGANFNYIGTLSRTGFVNTPTLGSDIDKDILDFLTDKETEGNIRLGSGGYLGDDFKALEEARLKTQEAQVAKGTKSEVNPEEVKAFSGGYRPLPGYMTELPNWEAGWAYFDFREPLDDKGRLGRLFGVGWGENDYTYIKQTTLFYTSLGGIIATTITTSLATISAGGLTAAQGAGAFIPFYGNWNTFSLIFSKTTFYDAENAMAAIQKGTNKELNGLVKNAETALNEQIATKTKALEGVEIKSVRIGEEGVVELANGQTIPANLLSDSTIEGLASGQVNTISSDVAKEIAQKQFLGDTGKTVAEVAKNQVADQVSVGGFWGSALGVVNTLMWAYMVYSLVDMIFEDTKTESIKVECKPWIQPTVPSGSNDICEQCNPDFHAGKEDGYVDKNQNPLSAKALKTCSEYKCKALGATCKLLNVGTGNETCVSISPYDVTSPVIKPWVDGFTDDYKTSVKETAGGMKIEQVIPINNNVRIAIKTDEPSQCKMSWNHSKKYNEMEPFYFGTQNYVYFHMQTIWVPNSGNNTEQAINLAKGGGNYKIYVRCQDGAGNANEKDYAVEFKIGPEKDITAPRIESASIPKETFLRYGTNKTDVTLYINEPATCKWSLLDQEFTKMSDKNKCGSGKVNSFGSYDCRFTGSGMANSGPAVDGLRANAGETRYAYFRCMDINKNVNKESYRIAFKGSDSLNISYIKPESGSEIVTTGSINVTLEVNTMRGAQGDGTASCKYIDNQPAAYHNINMMAAEFLQANTSVHTLILTDRPSGTYRFDVGCVDIAGNIAYANTTFKIYKDDIPPQIVRVYKDTSTTPAILRIDVDERSSCLYSTETGKAPSTAMIQDDVEGKKFSVQADKTNYYVQCEDGFGNKMAVSTIVLLDTPTGEGYSSESVEEETF